MVPDPGPPQNRNSTDEQRPAVKRLRRRQVKWSFSPLSKYTSRAKTGGPSRDSGVSRERVNGTETNEDSPQTKRLLAIRREQTLLSLVGPPVSLFQVLLYIHTKLLIRVSLIFGKPMSHFPN